MGAPFWWGPREGHEIEYIMKSQVILLLRVFDGVDDALRLNIRRYQRRATIPPVIFLFQHGGFQDVLIFTPRKMNGWNEPKNHPIEIRKIIWTIHLHDFGFKMYQNSPGSPGWVTFCAWIFVSQNLPHRIYHIKNTEVAELRIIPFLKRTLPETNSKRTWK